MSEVLNITDKPHHAQPPAGQVDDAAIMARGQAVLAAESAAIQSAAKRLGPAFVDVCRTVLHCRGRVCVTGVGKAGLIGSKIQATFASTGTPAYSLHPVEALHGDLGMVRGDDTVIALSKSGSSELVELLPMLKRLGCSVALLTANPSSSAARHSDLVLDIGDVEEACPLGLAPSSSTAAMLALGDAIALTVMELRDVGPEQYASYHPGGALGRYLMKARELMRTGPNCPTVRNTQTLSDCYDAILNAPARAGAAAVVDDDSRLVGIVTLGDFFRLFKDGGYDAPRSVTSVMTADPKHVHTDDRVNDALTLMRRHAIDELPVIDADNRLAGMIDVQDLIARGFSVFDTT